MFYQAESPLFIWKKGPQRRDVATHGSWRFWVARRPVRVWATAAVVTVSVTALGGCQRAEVTEGALAWFPLHAGQVQTYRVTESGEEHGDQPLVSEWTITAKGPSSLEGKPVWLRHHSEGVTFFLEASDLGIRRVATQPDIDSQPTPDTEPRWVLKAPFQVGTEWSTPTVPYLLLRKNEHPRALKHTHKLTMTWRIARTDAEVSTPAGTFKPCLMLEGQGVLNLFTDPVNGFNNVPIVSREWYCQGQGLVKFEREETVPKGFLTGGKLTAEWVR